MSVQVCVVCPFLETMFPGAVDWICLVKGHIAKISYHEDSKKKKNGLEFFFVFLVFATCPFCIVGELARQGSVFFFWIGPLADAVYKL